MVDVANADVVAILTRAPSSGGKSRLFDALGMSPDPELLTALLLDTVDAVRETGAPLVIAVTPGDACDEVAALVPTATVVSQPSGTLGDRMRDMMATLFTAGARTVVLIGSDLPAMKAAPVQAAIAHLHEHPDALVLGPAGDGGYYLVAAARLHSVFEGIDWAAGDTLSQTTAAARRLGVRVLTVEPLHDVDTPEDLARARQQLPRSRTARWAARHNRA